MLKIKRVLGAQRSYELLDGRIVPFTEFDKLQQEEITGPKIVLKKTTRRGRKKSDES